MAVAVEYDHATVGEDRHSFGVALGIVEEPCADHAGRDRDVHRLCCRRPGFVCGLLHLDRGRVGRGHFARTHRPHHADGKEYSGEDDDQKGRRRAGDDAAATLVVEDHEQAALQTRGPSHGDGGGAEEATRAEPRGDLQDVVGIVARRRTGGQYEVIACALSLGHHTPGGDPYKRVEPIEGAGDLGEELGQRIAAAEVGQLVQQDDAAAIGRPVFGFDRQQQTRAKDTPGHWHRPAAGPQQHDGAAKPQLDRQLREQCGP